MSNVLRVCLHRDSSGLVVVSNWLDNICPGEEDTLLMQPFEWVMNTIIPNIFKKSWNWVISFDFVLLKLSRSSAVPRLIRRKVKAFIRRNQSRCSPVVWGEVTAGHSQGKESWRTVFREKLLHELANIQAEVQSPGQALWICIDFSNDLDHNTGGEGKLIRKQVDKPSVQARHVSFSPWTSHDVLEYLNNAIRSVETWRLLGNVLAWVCWHGLIIQLWWEPGF